MQVVYIAGKFTADTAWGIENNIRKAEELALEVAKCGAMPLCPHTNTRFFYGQLTPEFWYEGTLELLNRCDGMILVRDNCNASYGVENEINFAIKENIPIFNTLDDLRLWLKGPRDHGPGAR